MSQDSQTPAEGNDSPSGSQDGSDIAKRINGLMSTLGKRTQERDDALRRLADLEQQLTDLDEFSTQEDDAEPEPEPYVDPNNPRKSPNAKSVTTMSESEIKTAIASFLARGD